MNNLPMRAIFTLGFMDIVTVFVGKFLFNFSYFEMIVYAKISVIVIIMVIRGLK